MDLDFCSTRDAAKHLSAAETVCRGLSDDGGLYLPTDIPQISGQQTKEMVDQNYAAAAHTILSSYLPGYTNEELTDAAAAYEHFSAPETAPLRKIGNDLWSLELWHGPTCACNDFALQPLPRLLAAAMKKCEAKNEAAVLTATSGDAAAAALQAFSNAPGIRVGAIYPHSSVSAIQRLQINTHTAENSAVISVDGTLDDLQADMKTVLAEQKLSKTMTDSAPILISGNSINWGCFAMHIVYYYWAYTRLLKQGAIHYGDSIDFCIPAGNFEYVLAGYYAKHSGLPIRNLICASNHNNVLTQFLTTGIYDRRRPLHHTQSPSMDLLVASNLERLLFLLTRDGQTVRAWMEELRRDGFYDIGHELTRQLHSDGFRAYSCDDSRSARTAGQLWEERGYLCDPHTAAAVNAAHHHRALTGEHTPMVVLSTVSPFKFPGTVLNSIHMPFSGTDFEKMEALSILSGFKIPDGLADLKNMPMQPAAVIPRESMKAAIYDWLKK